MIRGTKHGKFGLNWSVVSEKPVKLGLNWMLLGVKRGRVSTTSA